MRDYSLGVKVKSEVLKALTLRSRGLGLNNEELANEILSTALCISSNGISLEEELSLISSDQIKGLKQKHFSDAGARAYTSAARYEFQKYSFLKDLDYTNALEELSKIAIKYQYDFELISKILMGKHVITANEIADAVKETGKYPLHSLLQEWSSDPLQSLSKVLVGAIVIPSN